MEVNYGIGLAPGVSLMPFVQYVSHPDQYINPNPSANLNYSVMVGVGWRSASARPWVCRIL